MRLIAARDGSLWVATDSGLHRFFQGAWVENGTEEGLPHGGVRGLYEDPRGRIWAGTAHGLSLYHPEADPDPPRTFVETVGGQEKDIPEGGTITLLFSGLDKWKYTPRQRLLYSYRLNGRDWSPFQEERTVSFTDLPAGKHYLQVRAMDRNCNVDPTPARFEFVVVLPWYKESRLVGIAARGPGRGALLRRAWPLTVTANCSAATPRWSRKSPSARANWRSPTASCSTARR